MSAITNDEEYVASLVNLAFQRGVDAGTEIAITVINKPTELPKLASLIRRVTAEAMARSQFPAVAEDELLIYAATIRGKRADA